MSKIIDKSNWTRIRKKKKIVKGLLDTTFNRSSKIKMPEKPTALKAE